MKPAEFADFERVLRAFAELKSRTLSVAQIDLYWRAMQDWSLEDFRAASVRLLKTSKFFPTPSEFEDLRKAGRELSGDAFARAREHARSLPVSGGFIQEVPSGDDELDAVVRAIGGYRVIANASERDMQFLATRFAEHHESVLDVLDTREALPRIAAEKRPLLAAGGPRRLLEVTKP